MSRPKSLVSRFAEETGITYRAAYAIIYADRVRARNLLAAAIRAGVIVKPKRCSICRKQRKIQGHHLDYSQPYVVTWCCKPCHSILDTLRRRIEQGELSVLTTLVRGLDA